MCFVTAVGFIAGPKFFRNFKQNAKSYVLLGFIIILVGALSCAAIILLAKLPTALGVGLMTGALTSTPAWRPPLKLRATTRWLPSAMASPIPSA